jgi:hypothetical protein
MAYRLREPNTKEPVLSAFSKKADASEAWLRLLGAADWRGVAQCSLTDTNTCL